MNPESPAVAQIKLRLRDLAHLFNSLDPSPFLDRDLDRDAEEFIVSWARELPANREIELSIQLAAAPPSPVPAITEAVHRYFETRAAMKQLELTQLLRTGRVSLIVGLAFLGACLTVSELVLSRSGAMATVVKESLIIVGWVAMWRPLEIYLYDWWPIRAQRRVLERLARMRVTITLPDGKPCVVVEEKPRS